MPVNASLPQDLIANLHRAVTWPRERIADWFALLAQEKDLPIQAFHAAGQVWAVHPEGALLITAAIEAFRDTAPGETLFSAALVKAVRTNQMHIFNLLAYPNLDWKTSQQAETWRLIGQKEVTDQALWQPVFWAKVPQAARREVYARIARSASGGIAEGLEHLLVMHATVPQPDPADLVYGVVEGWKNASLHLTPVPHAWERLRDHVDPVAILQALSERMGERVSPQEKVFYAPLCDAILTDVPPAIRKPWLARTDLELPRAQAAQRHADLRDRPASPRSRTRSRS